MAVNPDHVELAAVGKELIEKNGRTVVIKRDATSKAVAGKPWLGRVSNDDDVSSGIGCVFDLEEARSDGATAVCYLAHDSFSSTTDLQTFNALIDGTVTWRITKTEVVQPGETPILYMCYLKR